jgi:hypothetical protein
MSDIGILNDPLSLIAIALIFGSPGLLLAGLRVRCCGGAGASPAGFWARSPAGGVDAAQGRDLKAWLSSSRGAAAWPRLEG